MNKLREMVGNAFVVVAYVAAGFITTAGVVALLIPSVALLILFVLLVAALLCLLPLTCVSFAIFILTDKLHAMLKIRWRRLCEMTPQCCIKRIENLINKEQKND